MDGHFGSIEVVCGCMFSGKSEELIRRVRRAQIARLKVQVFTHAMDDRYGEGKVASHNGFDLPARPIGEAVQIIRLTEQSTAVVAVDEAQFFDWALAEVAEKLAIRGLRVIIAGLDMDFRGEPFGVMPLLMAQADELTKFNAICTVCAGPASRTQRLIDGRAAGYDEPQVVVGASEMYEARCRLHHEIPRKQVSSHSGASQGGVVVS